VCLPDCPGFGQDRVNFHQNPGRDTDGGADPTWPNRAGYSILCAVMLGSGKGGGVVRRGGNSLAVRELVVAVVEGGSPDCAVCVGFSPYLYRCCYCFPSFAVLLNCPYPDPLVSACFFPFSSAPRRGEGQPRGAFVAGCSRNQNTDEYAGLT